MMTAEPHTNPIVRVTLELVEQERARGDRHLIRALDAEHEVRQLRAQLEHLTNEFVVEPNNGEPYVHLGSNTVATEYQHRIWMEALALVKAGTPTSA